MPQKPIQKYETIMFVHVDRGVLTDGALLEFGWLD